MATEPVGAAQVDSDFVLEAVELSSQPITSVPAGAELLSTPKPSHRAGGQPAAADWQCARLIGSCPIGGLQIRVLLDESGSVTSHADPIAYRHLMLSRALDALIGCCTCGLCTVELVTFGRSTASDVLSSGPVPLTRAGLAPVRSLLAYPPMTGSMMAGAVRALDQREHLGIEVAMVISDFELFDADPVQLYQQLAAAGPGIAAVLRTDPVSNELASSGLRIVQINAASPCGLLADALIDLVADNRGPLLLQPAKGVPSPSPVAAKPAPSKPQLPHRRSWWSGVWWWLIPLLIIGILLLLLAIHRHTSHSGMAAGSGQTATGQLASDAAGSSLPAAGLPPITLPPPQGSAIRTVPASTVWIIDPDAGTPAGSAHAVTEEVPLALAYQQHYALAGDRLALSAGSPLIAPGEQVTALDPRLGLLSPALQVAGQQPAAAVQAAQERLNQLSAPVDRIIVILTAAPQRWQSLLPAAIYRHPQAGQQHPEIRYYVVALTSGAASPSTLRLSDAGPKVIAADPAKRGQLAVALARTFVDGTDANWAGD